MLLCPVSAMPRFVPSELCAIPFMVTWFAQEEHLSDATSTRGAFLMTPGLGTLLTTVLSSGMTELAGLPYSRDT